MAWVPLLTVRFWCVQVVSVGQTRMKPLAKELEAAARREGAAKDALRAARGQCEERKQAFAASASRSQLSVKLMEGVCGSRVMLLWCSTPLSLL